MSTPVAKLAALALIVALCALRCTCGCMSDSLGAFLGHAAAPAHDCCHACDDAEESPAPGRTDRHDAACAADDRIPAPDAPSPNWPPAVVVSLDFPRPILAAPGAPRSLAAAANPPARPSSSLLRLHCALIV